jgi:hypothetical protein
MKKIFGVLMAATVCMALAVPAFAVENEFGGYWRTRGISMKDFDGTDAYGTKSYVDTRTRLYYTAKFNDKFKLVNKFEIDNGWGDKVGGDIGADGKQFEIKNTYVDFSMGDNNFKIGIQPGKIGRGFMFDDDFAGVTATFKLGAVSLPFMWMKVEDNDLDASASLAADNAGSDRDYLAVSPVFNLNETLTLNPYLFIDKQQGTETQVFYLGADINAKLDGLTAWGTAIFETGDYKDQDCAAYLLAAGADAGLVHGQAFYASGDKEAEDGDWEQFGLDLAWNKGENYYWSEIMGEGVFDGTRSKNAPGTHVSNVMAANIGMTVKPMDKLTLSGDVWYAKLVEEVGGEDDLGLEVDLKASYMLLDNMKLDVVAAYLFAGDATGDEDPIELGTQLSFSF